MSMLHEKDEKKIWVDFEVKGMRLEDFKEFKKLSRDYNGSYPITLKVLLDKMKTLEFILEQKEDMEIEEMEDEDGDVQTLGD